MAKLHWDVEGQHFFEAGVKECVLYPYTVTSGTGAYSPGVAWNGIASISESPSGAEPTAIYADDTKYLNMFSVEEFGCTIEAYTYPDEFAVLDGSKELVANSGVYVGQQDRGTFGLCYKTQIGNDTAGTDYVDPTTQKGYKLHLIYGCKASPSEKSYSTINDSPEANTFSWEITTTPVEVATGFKKCSTLVLDSTKISASKMALIEAQLFGTDTEGSTTGITANLPLPAAIKAILEQV